GVQIEGTISALRATGRFNKVELDVRPETDGLHLTFRLEPAFYFGMFYFPGAPKGFSYSRLLQVVDIPNQTPFQTDLVSRASENLRQFLTGAGYFQAQVQPEEQFDESHLLVHVVFHIILGKRAKVGNVEIRDSQGSEADRLLHDTRSLR